MLRLAQARTEVPPTEMKAAVPAPAFADSDPPLWDGLGSVTYKISTSSAEAQAYFDQGWSYYGLLQVYKARGDATAAAQAEAELAKTWIGDRQLLQIANL